MNDLNTLLELALDTAVGPAGVVLAIFLILLLALLLGTKRLIYAIWYTALFPCITAGVWLAWPGMSAFASANGWLPVIGLTFLITAIPLLVAAVPILLVARVRVHVAIKAGIGVLSSLSALVIFPLIGLSAACYLGDCI